MPGLVSADKWTCMSGTCCWTIHLSPLLSKFGRGGYGCIMIGKCVVVDVRFVYRPIYAVTRKRRRGVDEQRAVV